MSPRHVAPVRRAQIVDATIRCLAREGYSRLTMKAIAREAKLNQGILHYYFPDKRAILLAALDKVMGTLNRRAVVRAGGDRDPRARIRALIGACLDVADEQRDFWTVFVQFWSAMLYDPELRAANADLYRRLRSVIAGIVADGVKEGVFRPVGADEAAAVIVALADGLSLQRSFDEEAFTLPDALHFGEDAVLRYLGAA
jgi:AcrR family transcriptional regulator